MPCVRANEIYSRRRSMKHISQQKGLLGDLSYHLKKEMHFNTNNHFVGDREADRDAEKGAEVLCHIIPN